jgi:hypothetical protein
MLEGIPTTLKLTIFDRNNSAQRHTEVYVFCYIHHGQSF